jgi:hypothetical protein
VINNFFDMQRLVKITSYSYFDENKLLGEGAFGKVYEGAVDNIGAVAVKVVSLDGNRKLV